MRSRRARRITLAVAALLAFALVAAACTPEPPPPSSPAAADIVERHNYLRGLGGLGGLTVDGGMQANAQLHADRLAAGATTCAGALWHSSELASWYPGVTAGENVACVTGCPSDGATVIDLWMDSPPHRANVLRPDFAFIGVATRCNGTLMTAVAHYRSG